MAGAAELLSQIPAGSWGLVTSAGRALADSRMAAAGLPMPLDVVSADDVRESKPDPEGYLAAAARLGLDPSDAIVLEDGLVAVDGRRARGSRGLGVGDADRVACCLARRGRGADRRDRGASGSSGNV